VKPIRIAVALIHDAAPGRHEQPPQEPTVTMTRTRLNMLLWAGLPWLAIACQDRPHLTEPHTQPAVDAAVEALSPPALSATLADAISIGLEDALTRLVPDHAEALRFELSSLRTQLYAADTETLQTALTATRRALAALDMHSADADALNLALNNIEQALEPAAN
jgi:hypothetical protein